jgi:dolichol kinase
MKVQVIKKPSSLLYYHSSYRSANPTIIQKILQLLTNYFHIIAVNIAIKLYTKLIALTTRQDSMKQRQAVLIFFFVAWGTSVLFLLREDEHIAYIKLFGFSIGMSIVATVIYAMLRQPVLHIIRYNFDKTYRHSMRARKKRRA